MEIDAIYTEIISSLKTGGRPRKRFDRDEYEIFAKKVNDLNESFINGHIELKLFQEQSLKIICILSHSVNPPSLFDQFIITIIKTDGMKYSTYIVALGCFQEVIVQRFHKNGDKIPRELLTPLKSTLSKNDPETLLWTLKTIEGLGKQSIIFRQELENIKVGPFKFLNKHKKESREIINRLLQRWEKIPKL